MHGCPALTDSTGHGRRHSPRPAFCRVATAPSRSNSAAPSTRTPTGEVLALDRAHRAAEPRGRHRDGADLSLAAGALRSAADRLRCAGRKADRRWRTSRLRRRPRRRRWRIPVVYGGENGIDLEDVAKALNTTPDEIVRAACRRRLQRRHDRLHAGLVLSQRARRDSLHMPRRQDPRLLTPAGTDLHRRRADRRAVPGRPQRLASAGAHPRAHLSAPPRSHLPAGTRRRHHLHRGRRQDLCRAGPRGRGRRIRRGADRRHEQARRRVGRARHVRAGRRPVRRAALWPACQRARWIGWRWPPPIRWSATRRSRRPSKSARSAQSSRRDGGAVRIALAGATRHRPISPGAPFNVDTSVDAGRRRDAQRSASARGGVVQLSRHRRRHCAASRCSAASPSMPAPVSAVPIRARCRPATNCR